MSLQGVKRPDSGGFGPLLFLAAILLATLTRVATAPLNDEEDTSLETYDGESGCYYNFQHYGEGDRIMTNEPCLNCTCHNRMLMCYLRVCPFTKPIGQDCTVEKRGDQCCPVITCPDVRVDLLTSTSTLSPESGSTEVGHLDVYGCTINSRFFSEGSQVPLNPDKPCELCYCVRNMTACVMQECTLHVDGCTPVYHRGVCCPVRYACEHPENQEPLMLDEQTTTIRPTTGFVITTTDQPSTASQGCTHNDFAYADGASIKTGKMCEHCYCMKGRIICAVQECGLPMENEGKNCTALPPREGQCCPDTYICENDIFGSTLNLDTTPSIAEITIATDKDDLNENEVSTSSTIDTSSKVDYDLTLKPEISESQTEKIPLKTDTDNIPTATITPESGIQSTGYTGQEIVVESTTLLQKKPDSESSVTSSQFDSSTDLTNIENNLTENIPGQEKLETSSKNTLITQEESNTPSVGVGETTPLVEKVTNKHVTDVPTTNVEVATATLPEITTHNIVFDLTPTEIIDKEESTEIASTSLPISINVNENEIDEGQSPQIAPRIPGEGSCLVDGITYANNSIIPVNNKCQSSCKCTSSIVRCESISCGPSPSNLDRCQPVIIKDSCCPTYTCVPEIPETPISDNQMTESPVNEEIKPISECGLADCLVTTDLTIVKPNETHVEGAQEPSEKQPQDSTSEPECTKGECILDNRFPNIPSEEEIGTPSIPPDVPQINNEVTEKADIETVVQYTTPSLSSMTTKEELSSKPAFEANEASITTSQENETPSSTLPENETTNENEVSQEISSTVKSDNGYTESAKEQTEQENTSPAVSDLNNRFTELPTDEENSSTLVSPKVVEPIRADSEVTKGSEIQTTPSTLSVTTKEEISSTSTSQDNQTPISTIKENDISDETELSQDISTTIKSTNELSENVDQSGAQTTTPAVPKITSPNEEATSIFNLEQNSTPKQTELSSITTSNNELSSQTENKTPETSSEESSITTPSNFRKDITQIVNQETEPGISTSGEPTKKVQLELDSTTASGTGITEITPNESETELQEKSSTPSGQEEQNIISSSKIPNEISTADEITVTTVLNPKEASVVSSTPEPVDSQSTMIVDIEKVVTPSSSQEETTITKQSTTGGEHFSTITPSTTIIVTSGEKSELEGNEKATSIPTTSEINEIPGVIIGQQPSTITASTSNTYSEPEVTSTVPTTEVIVENQPEGGKTEKYPIKQEPSTNTIEATDNFTVKIPEDSTLTTVTNKVTEEASETSVKKDSTENVTATPSYNLIDQQTETTSEGETIPAEILTELDHGEFTELVSEFPVTPIIFEETTKTETPFTSKEPILSTIKDNEEAYQTTSGESESSKPELVESTQLPEKPEISDSTTIVSPVTELILIDTTDKSINENDKEPSSEITTITATEEELNPEVVVTTQEVDKAPVTTEKKPSLEGHLYEGSTTLEPVKETETSPTSKATSAETTSLNPSDITDYTSHTGVPISTEGITDNEKTTSGTYIDEKITTVPESGSSNELPTSDQQINNVITEGNPISTASEVTSEYKPETEISVGEQSSSNKPSVSLVPSEEATTIKSDESTSQTQENPVSDTTILSIINVSSPMPAQEDLLSSTGLPSVSLISTVIDTTTQADKTQTVPTDTRTPDNNVGITEDISITSPSHIVSEIPTMIVIETTPQGENIPITTEQSGSSDNRFGLTEESDILNNEQVPNKNDITMSESEPSTLLPTSVTAQKPKNDISTTLPSADLLTIPIETTEMIELETSTEPQRPVNENEVLLSTVLPQRDGATLPSESHVTDKQVETTDGSSTPLINVQTSEPQITSTESTQSSLPFDEISQKPLNAYLPGVEGETPSTVDVESSPSTSQEITKEGSVPVSTISEEIATTTLSPSTLNVQTLPETVTITVNKTPLPTETGGQITPEISVQSTTLSDQTTNANEEEIPKDVLTTNRPLSSSDNEPTTPESPESKPTTNIIVTGGESDETSSQQSEDTSISEQPNITTPDVSQEENIKMDTSQGSKSSSTQKISQEYTTPKIETPEEIPTDLVDIQELTTTRLPSSSETPSFTEGTSTPSEQLTTLIGVSNTLPSVTDEITDSTSFTISTPTTKVIYNKPTLTESETTKEPTITTSTIFEEAAVTKTQKPESEANTEENIPVETQTPVTENIPQSHIYIETKQPEIITQGSEVAEAETPEPVSENITTESVVAQTETPTTTVNENITLEPAGEELITQEPAVTLTEQPETIEIEKVTQESVPIETKIPENEVTNQEPVETETPKTIEIEKETQQSVDIEALTPESEAITQEPVVIETETPATTLIVTENISQEPLGTETKKPESEVMTQEPIVVETETPATTLIVTENISQEPLGTETKKPESEVMTQEPLVVETETPATTLIVTENISQEPLGTETKKPESEVMTQEPIVVETETPKTTEIEKETQQSVDTEAITPGSDVITQEPVVIKTETTETIGTENITQEPLGTETKKPESEVITQEPIVVETETPKTTEIDKVTQQSVDIDTKTPENEVITQEPEAIKSETTETIKTENITQEPIVTETNKSENEVITQEPIVVETETPKTTEIEKETEQSVDIETITPEIVVITEEPVVTKTETTETIKTEYITPEPIATETKKPESEVITQEPIVVETETPKTSDIEKVTQQSVDIDTNTPENEVITQEPVVVETPETIDLENITQEPVVVETTNPETEIITQEPVTVETITPETTEIEKVTKDTTVVETKKPGSEILPLEPVVVENETPVTTESEIITQNPLLVETEKPETEIVPLKPEVVETETPETIDIEKVTQEPVIVETKKPDSEILPLEPVVVENETPVTTESEKTTQESLLVDTKNPENELITQETVTVTGTPETNEIEQVTKKTIVVETKKPESEITTLKPIKPESSETTESEIITQEPIMVDTEKPESHVIITEAPIEFDVKQPESEIITREPVVIRTETPYITDTEKATQEILVVETETPETTVNENITLEPVVETKIPESEVITKEPNVIETKPSDTTEIEKVTQNSVIVEKNKPENEVITQEPVVVEIVTPETTEGENITQEPIVIETKQPGGEVITQEPLVADTEATETNEIEKVTQETVILETKKPESEIITQQPIETENPETTVNGIINQETVVVGTEKPEGGAVTQEPLVLEAETTESGKVTQESLTVDTKTPANELISQTVIKTETPETTESVKVTQEPLVFDTKKPEIEVITQEPGESEMHVTKESEVVNQVPVVVKTETPETEEITQISVTSSESPSVSVTSSEKPYGESTTGITIEEETTPEQVHYTEIETPTKLETETPIETDQGPSGPTANDIFSTTEQGATVEDRFQGQDTTPAQLPSGEGAPPAGYGTSAGDTEYDDQEPTEQEQVGPGTCRYGGKVYVSAQQIPRDDPCDFCFCFRSDIICLQQSCPPPIHGCHEEPISGFCCPRYECPVSMATSLNVTTTTTTTTTTLPPHFLPHAYKGAARRQGCQIKGHAYKVGEVVRASSGPCLHCTCGGDGQMKCEPKVCTPEPMLRQMIAAAVSTRRR